jgi:hypothetical protein
MYSRIGDLPVNLPHICLQVRQKEHLQKQLEKSKKTVRVLEVKMR